MAHQAGRRALDSRAKLPLADPLMHGNDVDLRGVHVWSYSCFRAAENTIRCIPAHGFNK
jgi:hypothetical protein